MLDFIPTGEFTSEVMLDVSDLRQFSVASWGIKRTGSTFPIIVAAMASGADVGWQFALFSQNLDLTVQGSSGVNFWTSNTATSTGFQHHAVTYDGGVVAGSASFWFDGVEDTHGFISGGGGRAFGVGAAVQLSGTTISGGASTQGYTAVWNRVLHEAEIVSLANKRSPFSIPNGLRHYWRLEDPAIAMDLVGNVNCDFRTAGLKTPVLDPIGIVDPPRFKFQSQEHNPVDLAPGADTMFPLRRQGHRIRRHT